MSAVSGRDRLRALFFVARHHTHEQDRARVVEAVVRASEHEHVVGGEHLAPGGYDLLAARVTGRDHARAGARAQIELRE